MTEQDDIGITPTGSPTGPTWKHGEGQAGDPGASGSTPAHGAPLNTDPTGGSAYRCTRGGAGCGADIGHPANQDQHNQDVHANSGWNRPGEGAPVKRSAVEDDIYGEYNLEDNAANNEKM